MRKYGDYNREMLDRVEETLESFGVNFKKDDADGVCIFGIKMENVKDGVFVFIGVSQILVNITVKFGFDAQPKDFLKTSLYLSMVNSQLTFGRFVLDFDKGSITYRNVFIFNERRVSATTIDMLKAYIRKAINDSDDYGGGLEKVVFEGANPVEEFTRLKNLKEIDNPKCADDE